MAIGRPRVHRDGSVTYWSVYRQVWDRTTVIPDDELAAMPMADRRRCMLHLASHGDHAAQTWLDANPRTGSDGADW